MPAINKKAAGSAASKKGLDEYLSGLTQNGEGDRRDQVQKDVLKPLRTSFSNRSDFPPTLPPTQLWDNLVTPGTFVD